MCSLVKAVTRGVVTKARVESKRNLVAITFTIRRLLALVVVKEGASSLKSIQTISAVWELWVGSTSVWPAQWEE